MSKLGEKEINSVVSYIGVRGGYLGNFTYPTHAEFYPLYCGLDYIYPNDYSGTTRERFITILKNANANEQSKILSGILEKYPLYYFEEQFENERITKAEFNSKQRLHEKLNQLIADLNGELVEIGELEHDFEFVKKVLDQSETLIANHSYSSAIDRVHTALHAYLKEICKDANIKFEKENVKVQELWSKIKSDHPKFNVDIKEHNKPINQIVSTISKTLENLNDIRNNQSFSHPNEEIIEEPEAKLIINLSRVLLQYIDNKISS